MKRMYWLLGCLMFGTMALAIDIDGVVLGQASCEEAIKKSYQKVFEKCMEVPKEKAPQERCQNVGARGIKKEIKRFKEWKPAEQLCSPAFGVYENVKRAFDLREGYIDFAKQGIKTCPFKKFYHENQMGTVLCLQGKAVFYNKTVRATVGQTKKKLISKYGKPQEWKSGKELPKLMDSLRAKNSLFSVKGGKILLVQERSEKAWPTDVHYFTDDFLKVIKDDSAKYEKLQKAQKQKVKTTKKNSDLEEL